MHTTEYLAETVAVELLGWEFRRKWGSLVDAYVRLHQSSGEYEWHTKPALMSVL